MESVSEKNNFVYLIFSLIALLLVGALVDQFPGGLGKHTFQAITIVTLAVSIVGFRSTRLHINTGHAPAEAMAKLPHWGMTSSNHSRTRLCKYLVIGTPRITRHFLTSRVRRERN